MRLRLCVELSSAEVSSEPDPDGRLVRRPESRRSEDLTTFGTKGLISTYLRLDQQTHTPSPLGARAKFARPGGEGVDVLHPDHAPPPGKTDTHFT
eukprot:3084226-Prymnesium_polylepis.1